MGDSQPDWLPVVGVALTAPRAPGAGLFALDKDYLVLLRGVRPTDEGGGDGFKTRSSTQRFVAAQSTKCAKRGSSCRRGSHTSWHAGLLDCNLRHLPAPLAGETDRPWAGCQDLRQPCATGLRDRQGQQPHRGPCPGDHQGIGQEGGRA